MTDDSFDDTPVTLVTPPRCPGCTNEFEQLDDDVQPPGTYEEAWKKPIVCRGTKKWWWCRAMHERQAIGRLMMIGHEGAGGMEVVFFPERRVTVQPVAVERRRPKP